MEADAFGTQKVLKKVGRLEAKMAMGILVYGQETTFKASRFVTDVEISHSAILMINYHMGVFLNNTGWPTGCFPWFAC